MNESIIPDPTANPNYARGADAIAGAFGLPWPRKPLGAKPKSGKSRWGRGRSGRSRKHHT